MLNWSKYIPPEDFYFFDVSLFNLNETNHKGWFICQIPTTKRTEHFQKPDNIWNFCFQELMA